MADRAGPEPSLLASSDWPLLKAPERLDVGPLITLVEQRLPSAADRRRLLWDTPCRVFGFPSSV